MFRSSIDSILFRTAVPVATIGICRHAHASHSAMTAPSAPPPTASRKLYTAQSAVRSVGSRSFVKSRDCNWRYTRVLTIEVGI